MDQSLQMRSIWSTKRFQEALGNYSNDLLYFTLCLFPLRGNHHLVMLTKLLNMHYIHYLAIHPQISEYPLRILIQFYKRSSLFQDLNKNCWNYYSVSLSRWPKLNLIHLRRNSIQCLMKSSCAEICFFWFTFEYLRLIKTCFYLN